MSVLKGKVGFVIPKNKFSGSLVPIFKKSDNNDAATQQTNKDRHQRKTRWGADLTQDTTVKRGRALAYQTRVDQITEQLKLGLTKSDDQNSNSARDVPDSELSTIHIKLEKFQSLELERREAIGEILKLNPGYKTPSDYEPVLREATVPLPVKAHPEYNFLGLVYGSDGETQKRMEKETGTRIQVYGTLRETGKKVEITPSDGSDALRVCEEAYVRISADTYEKIDAAADLIELLLNSVLVKPADHKAIISDSGDGQDIAATTVNTSSASQEIIQPLTGPRAFHPYPISWFPAGQSGLPSGGAPVPSSGPLFNHSFQRPSFGTGPPGPYFGSSPRSTTMIPPRLHSPPPNMQGMQSRVGQTGAPRNFSAPTSPLGGHQPNNQNSQRITAPQLAERPLGWSSPAPPSALSGSSSQYPSPQGRPSGTSFDPSQIRSSSAGPFQSFTPQIQLNSSRSSQFPIPRPSPSPGLPTPGHAYQPSFTPLNHTVSPLQGANDFTFNPHIRQGPPSQSLPGSSVHFPSQRANQVQLPPAPQMPSFRPALQSTIQQPVRQSFPRPLIGNQMGPSSVEFGNPNLNPYMGQRNHGPVPQFTNATGPPPPRTGPTAQFQQNQNRHGGFGGNQHSGPSGRPQVYDPFLPSSLPAPPAQPQGGNNGMVRKQESDPEYEDLMASVGVK
ncbi:uncharacterized protein LOC141604842 [Silene latifolia]|uniref:uncharacterized protein LOC141604842 n=1 Tax=Silene latifolia TaxID=37657 RepID=UPI003D77427F